MATRTIEPGEVIALLQQRKGQFAELENATIGGNRYRVTRGERSTTVIVPSRVTDLAWKQMTKKLEDYFSFFGLGNPAPFKPMEKK